MLKVKWGHGYLWSQQMFCNIVWRGALFCQLFISSCNFNLKYKLQSVQTPRILGVKSQDKIDFRYKKLIDMFTVFHCIYYKMTTPSLAKLIYMWHCFMIWYGTVESLSANGNPAFLWKLWKLCCHWLKDFHQNHVSVIKLGSGARLGLFCVYAITEMHLTWLRSRLVMGSMIAS